MSDVLLNHAEKFIVDKNLKHGTRYHGFRTQSIIIYWYYMQWCVDNNEVPLTRRQFFKQFRVHFTKHRFPYKIWYDVLPEAFVINREVQRAAEMDLRDETIMRKHSTKIKEGLKRWRAQKRQQKKDAIK